MSTATRAWGISRIELRKRQRQIESWYPYEGKALPAEVEPAAYFVTDPAVVRLVEQHLIPAMPAALFFSGSYRKEPGGTAALEMALADFEAMIDAAGHKGRYFAVAARDPYDRYTGASGRIHVHAIIDYSPHIKDLVATWAVRHGMSRGGLADPGAYFYVAKHYTNRVNENVVLDRTMLAAPVA